MKRRGFTLVELLIVIVVIGVLSAMMMLSSTEAVSSAKATEIVSNLRSLKTSAVAWYVSNLDFIDKGAFTGLNQMETRNVKDEIAKYMGNEDVSAYQFSGKDAGTWCVWLEVSEGSVREKLKSRAGSVGLLGIEAPNDNASSGDVYDGTQSYVGMFIR